jgi:hypothetical protein
VHVGVKGSEGHSGDFVVFSVSCDEVIERSLDLVFEVVVSG